MIFRTSILIFYYQTQYLISVTDFLIFSHFFPSSVCGYSFCQEKGRQKEIWTFFKLSFSFKISESEDEWGRGCQIILYQEQIFAVQFPVILRITRGQRVSDQIESFQNFFLPKFKFNIQFPQGSIPDGLSCSQKTEADLQALFQLQRKEKQTLVEDIFHF